MLTPYRFFHRHAGVSWNPAIESQAQGCANGARKLAAAERQARDAGFSFGWEVDPDVDSSEHLGKQRGGPYALWQCTCRNADGAIIASLGAIDFGRDGEPWEYPYHRVIEAELAAEALQP